MRRRWLTSLRTEGASVLLVFVLAAGLIYAYAARSAVRESQIRARSERIEDARALAQRFDAILQLGRERLAAVAGQPGLALWLASPQAKALPPRATIPQNETLHYLFFQSDIFSGPVALVDGAGVLLWTEPFDAERVDARIHVDHVAVRRALADGAPQLSAVPLRWREGPAAVLVQPILDLHRRPVGALIGEIDLRNSRLAAFLSEPRLGSSGGAALLDSEGAPLLSTGGPFIAPPDRLPSDGTAGRVSVGAIRWLEARAALVQAPWSMLVAQQESEALAPMRRLETSLVLIGLVLAAVALALSFVILGRVVRPIEVITEAASGVAAGNFSLPVPDGAPGELGDLSRAFVAMRRDLQSTLRGLQESEERYRRSIDSANDAIFAIDPDGFGILHVNLKAIEVTGATEAQLQGHTFVDLALAEQADVVRRFLASAAAAGIGTLEADLPSRSGTRLPVSISATLIVHGGGRFLQLICRDLSERKRMEHELVQAEKMSTIGVLAAGILHELGTPLSYAVANLEQAKADVGRLPAAPATLRSEIEDAMDGAQRASIIARDLRIFARAQEGTTSFDVNDAVRMALRMAQHELRYRATVVTELGDVPPVRGRAIELSQVFLNLLVNAAHAIPHGDPKANRICVSTEVQRGAAIARVSDSGAGIPAALLPRIFDPFFTTKPEGAGTGLGLAIARDIVRRAGGRIEVESRVGEGTTFTIELPLAGGEVT